MTRSNLTLLAQGNTAEIYDYAPDKILKLFRPDFPPEPILAEYEKSQFVSHELSNVPKPYDLIALGARRGIIYEKVAGPSMIVAMLKSPHKLKQNSRQLAQIHFAIHSYYLSQAAHLALISVKDKLAADIDAVEVLTPAEKSHIKSHLYSLPDGNSLLHFDFHPGNILLRPATPVVIDWMTACIGDPCADVARTYLLLKYGELAHANFLLRKSARPLESYIGKIYLAEYLKLSHLPHSSPERSSLNSNLNRSNFERSDFKHSGLKKWLLPVAAARLREWITPHEQEQLLHLIRKALKQP